MGGAGSGLPYTVVFSPGGRGALDIVAVITGLTEESPSGQLDPVFAANHQAACNSPLP